MSIKKLVVATSAILLMGALAAHDESSKGQDATAASVASLRASLGNPAGLEIDEVRVTDAGVACIDYHTSGLGAKSVGHAVVQGKGVLKSSTRDARFEKAWNEHCLGPRGGVTSDP